jgi:hypothetical protein
MRVGVVVALVSLAVVLGAAAVVLAFRWFRRRRGANADTWAEHAVALSDEAQSFVQLLLTISADPRRMDDASLWAVARRQFVRLSAWAIELADGAPNRATRSGVDAVRGALATLEFEVAHFRSRVLIRTEAVGEIRPRPDMWRPGLRQRVDELSFAAGFLAIVACEDAR